jgi:hypothetical protein
VPLVGVAPSGFNLASGTYSRVTGLKGDGAAMYLDSNRANNGDPQNNNHLAVYLGGGSSVSTTQMLLGCRGVDVANTHDIYINTGSGIIARNKTTNTNHLFNQPVFSPGANPGFAGHSRVASTSIDYRCFGVNGSGNFISANFSGNIFVFSRNDLSGLNSRLFTSTSLSFYSIGESLNLALLDARVSGLMVAISGTVA